MAPIRLAYAARVSQEKHPQSVIEAVKLLARNGTEPRRDVRTVLSWPVARRRAAARHQAERYPWPATVQRMLNLHATVAEGRVDRTIARTEDTR